VWLNRECKNCPFLQRSIIYSITKIHTFEFFPLGTRRGPGNLKIEFNVLSNSILVVGDVPCIVSSGESGFIPVRFLSGSTIHMSGHSKL